MYHLETSTGFRADTTTVEQVASALALQLQNDGALDWTVLTPHGTVLSGADLGGPAGESSALADDRDAQIDRAYALLVRDHLTRGAGSIDGGGLLATGLLHTSR